MSKILTTILDMYLNGPVQELHADYSKIVRERDSARAEVETLRLAFGESEAELERSCAEVTNGKEVCAGYHSQVENLQSTLWATERKLKTTLETNDRLSDEAAQPKDEAEVQRMCGLIETLRDDLGAARAERDHALEGGTITLGEDGVSTYTATHGSSVSTSTDGIEWTEREEGPGYGELGAALTERDEALEEVYRTRTLIKSAAGMPESVALADLTNMKLALTEVATERDEALEAVDRLEELLAETARALFEARTQMDALTSQALNGELGHDAEDVEQLQGALLLARGGLVKARELAVVSEDAIKMFFALEPTSDGQRDLYPVRGELIAKFRKVVALAEVLRLLRS